MRKIVVLTFITIDGVMQSPGGPEEDASGDFAYGGWSVPYFDDFLNETMDKQMISEPFDLLLGKTTYQIMGAFWSKQTDDEPGAAELNKAKKYVVGDASTDLFWKESELVEGDVVAKLKALKEQDGPMLQVHGSGNLIQTLLKNDLVDELWLKIFPVTIGSGKRLFADGTAPAAFELLEAKTSPSGVIVASYKKAGDLKVGSFS